MQNLQTRLGSGGGGGGKCYCQSQSQSQSLLSIPFFNVLDYS